MQEFKRVAVIGAGTMGSGIAHRCAQSGLAVSMVDTDQAFLDRGMSSISTSVGRFIRSKKLTQEEGDAVIGRIAPTISFVAAVKEADVVIEAVPEQLELKQQVFRKIAEVAKPGTLLATNTSQLSITEIASATPHPEDIIGMHFFNPPILMQLIEIVPGLKTSQKTRDGALALCNALGMEAAVCKRDTVGFITTRAAIAMRLECFRMYEEGVASIEDIDRAMRVGFNHPMGPFELNDYNGLEVGLANAESLKKAYGDRFAPPQALVSRVRAGMLGRKTGQGWYDYSGEKPTPIN